MKKMLFGAFLWMFALAWVAVLPNYANAQDVGNQGNNEGKTSNNDWFVDAGWWGAQNTDYSDGLVAGSSKLQGDSLINVIKTAIKWVLGILSLIALALCLWGGFKMMTSGGDQKKYEEGLNILKWAAIGLAVIAVSWLIVSFIFWIINWAIKWGSVKPNA